MNAPAAVLSSTKVRIDRLKSDLSRLDQSIAQGVAATNDMTASRAKAAAELAELSAWVRSQEAH